MKRSENQLKDVTLVVMAAGIGSRFGGGIKQLEPVGPNGEIIMDYSIYDAIQAGFNKVVFVIRKDLEKDFDEIIGQRIKKKIHVEYAFQELSNIPSQYKEIFKERKKPWGTGQAVLCCKDVVKEPFVTFAVASWVSPEYSPTWFCSGSAMLLIPLLGTWLEAVMLPLMVMVSP